MENDTGRIYQCSLCNQLFDEKNIAIQHFQECTSDPSEPKNVQISEVKKIQTPEPKRLHTSEPKRLQTSAPKRIQTPAPTRIQTSEPKRVHTNQQQSWVELNVLSCQTCDFRTLQENTVQDHIIRKHDCSGSYSVNKVRFAKKAKPTQPSVRPPKISLPIITKHRLQQVFSCHQCSFKSPNYEQFRKHIHAIVKKSEASQLFCMFCPFVCKQKLEMDEHCSQQHSILKTIAPLRLDYTCLLCRETLPDASSLSEHSARCGRSQGDEIDLIYPKMNCEDCSFGTNAKHLLEFHIHVMHSSYPCKDCSEIFASKRLLLHHYQSKHAPNCPQCNISFESQEELQKHEELKHLEAFTCSVCGARTSSESALSKHISSHNSKICGECDKLFETCIDLKNHVSEVHPKNNMLGKNVCLTCYHVLCTPAALEVHKEQCALTMSVCVSCETSCCSIVEMLDHVMKTHEDVAILECDRCSHKAVDATVHLNHQLIHIPLPSTSGSSKYQCSICQKWTSSASSLRTHVNNHNKLKPYRCEFCAFTTSSCGNLRAHRAVRHLNTDQNVKCTMCNRRYRTVGQMHKHVKKTHDQILSFKCEYCENRFVTQLRLKRHLAVVHYEDAEASTGYEPYAGINRFRCEVPECTYSSYSANRFRLHRARHGEGLKCPYCELSFPLMDVLNRHINVRHLKRHVTCDICSRRLPNEGRLNQHMEACHVEGAETIQCAVCGFCFESLAHLEYHRRSHLTAKNFECPTCKRAFTTAASLCVHRLRHSKMMTSRSRSFVGNSNWVFYCEFCKFRFKYKSSLLAHQIAVHSDNSDLTCQYCQKNAFSSKLLLAYHIRKHIREKSFPCDRCDKKFTTQSSRNNHVITVHTKSFKFHCSYCNKGMLSQTKLHLHELHAHKDGRRARSRRLEDPGVSQPDDIIDEEEHVICDDNLLTQEIIVSTVEDGDSLDSERHLHESTSSVVGISGTSADILNQILENSSESQLVQITVGADGDQIEHVDLESYVIE